MGKGLRGTCLKFGLGESPCQQLIQKLDQIAVCCSFVVLCCCRASLLHSNIQCSCISSVQLLSRVRLFATPWTAACRASLSITNCWRLPKPMSIELVMSSNHLTLCHLLLILPSIFPSIRALSNELSLCIRWSKYWSFSISPSNKHSGLTSPLGLTGLIPLPCKGLLRVFLSATGQKHQFFGAQHSLWSNFHIHNMTTGKTITLTIWTFVSKGMSLLLIMLFRFFIVFLPRSKCLNFMASVTIYSDFGAQENKVCHCFHCFPIYLP